VDTPEEFWSTVKDVFDEVTALFAKRGLWISSAREDAGEFLIGDTPALRVRLGNLTGGPKDPVPPNEASNFFMPIDPKHVASLAPENGEDRVNAQQVTLANRAQIANAFNEVCFRPGSGLLVVVRSVLAERHD
jgi:hypothetical protein